MPDLAELEEAVQRLRELHRQAGDDERSGMALLLGLAICDLAGQLPPADPRLGDLAREGLVRLDQSGAATEPVARGREVLRGRLAVARAARSSAPAAEPREAEPPEVEGIVVPENLRLAAGDLTWNVDWDQLRRAGEDVRKAMAGIRLMMPGLDGPLQQFTTQAMAIVDQIETGEWTPASQQTLEDLIRLSQTTGVGQDIAVFMQALSMMFRIRWYLSAGPAADPASRPSLAEIDQIIAGLESEPDVTFGLGPPFDTFNGMSRLLTAVMMMSWLALDLREGGRRRDRAWFEATIQRLERVRVQIKGAPPAFAGQFQATMAQIDRIIADLRGKLGADGQAGTAAPAPPPTAAPVPESPSVPESRATPESATAPEPQPPAAREPVPPDPVAAGPRDPLPPLDLSAPISQSTIDGLRVVFDSLPASPLKTVLQSMAQVSGSSLHGQWTPVEDDALSSLQEVADQLAQGSPGRPEALIARMGLSFVRNFRRHPPADDSPAGPPPLAELTAEIAEVEEILDQLPQADGMATDRFAWLLHWQAGMLLNSLARHPDLDAGDGPAAQETRADLRARARDHLSMVPADLHEQFPILKDVLVFERAAADDEVFAREADRLRDLGAERFDSMAGGLPEAREAVARARTTRAPGEIAAAISQLRAVRRGLPPAHPDDAEALTLLAEMLGQQAQATGSRQVALDAISAATGALRAAPQRLVVKGAADRLISLFGLMLNMSQAAGPVPEAEEALGTALAAADSGDWELRVILTVAVGAARSLRAGALDGTHECLTDAEQLLPAPESTDEWCDAARTVFRWAAMCVAAGHDDPYEAIALRMADRLEAALAGDPALAVRAATRYGSSSFLQDLENVRQFRQRRRPGPAAGDHEPGPDPLPAGQARRLARRGLERAASALGSAHDSSAHDGGGPSGPDGSGPDGTASRRPLAADRPPAASAVQEAIGDLHAALGGEIADSEFRNRVDAALGMCLAEIYWLGEDGLRDAGGAVPPDADGLLARVLTDATEHLNRALDTGGHALPTVERAEQLEVLARCYRELARRDGSATARSDAERTARAAIRELASCVLGARDTQDALDIAARANEVVARTIHWCLADDRGHAAVEVAEAGRGLVLASAVLAGRVEQVLRGAGQHEAADEWRSGGAAGRARGLDVLWETGSSASLLAAPGTSEISVRLAATDFDAIVYLIPPAPPDGPGDTGAGSGRSGQALIVRGLTGQLGLADLPGLLRGATTPLEDYLAAFGTALASHDPQARPEAGFRGTPAGQAWADALEQVGFWAYDLIVEPLIEHIQEWHLGRIPRVVLIPLGTLAAIPFAAAWTADQGLPAGRRYAVHDLMLTQLVSARLLLDVIRRPRQRLTDRVVLVTDPTGEFPYARRTAKALAERQYPKAEVYGRVYAHERPRNGPATAAALLAALPGEDRPGASLLHLFTHGTTTPTAQLATTDGWLSLGSILDQARNRPPGSVGGLVITNACLTDSAHAHHDESLTLAAAFLAAGATAVIGTRWPIEDSSAAILATRMHFHLQMGRLPAEALRLAQLDLISPGPDLRQGLHPHLAAIEDDTLAHPASWAGYVHQGI